MSDKPINHWLKALERMIAYERRCDTNGTRIKSTRFRHTLDRRYREPKVIKV